MNHLSQTRTQAGQGAVFLTIFAIVWDVVVLEVLIPLGDAPVWFKAAFVLAGVAVTGAALYAWRQRLKGGSVRMTLSHDPVPHGVPVSASFQIDHSISAEQWLVEAKIESSARSQSGFGLLWSQDYRAIATDTHHVRAEVTLPSDFPSTDASDRDTRYRVTLTLKANGLEWAFDLNTRNATASEAMFGKRDARSLGSKQPMYTPEQVAAARKRLQPWLAGLVVLTVLWQLSSFFDLDLWSRIRAFTGSGTYATAVDTPEFEVRVTNALINDWALRGRLIARARVVNGTLVARVESLSVQPVGACTDDSRLCEIESVRLLLSRDGKGSFDTLAQSDPIPVNADLRQVTRWSLPPELSGIEIRMPLPRTIDTDGVRLKLEIRSAGGATVYPHHGPQLNLQRALATASASPDPCERIRGKPELVRAGCHERLHVALTDTGGAGAAIESVWTAIRQRADELAAQIGLGTTPPAPRETPDELLLEALRTENFSAVPVLLAAGASPDAHSPDDKGRTALGYAAASNDVAMIERLLKAGAHASVRHANEQGQIVTPLTQALRTDAALAIRRLLQAGAETSTNDPTGWTPMHIAAYESAHLSLAELVNAGANVNERTPAYRQHTPLQTALQFGSLDTVRTLLQLGADRTLQDNQGKDACDWAQFFKRPEDIRALVCL